MLYSKYKGGIDMKKEKRLSLWDILLYITIIFYIYFLLSNILFKYVTPAGLFESGRYYSRSINLIPFSDLFKGVYNSLDIFGNMILFMPFGLYLKILRPNNKIIKNIFLFFLISLSFETSQYILAIGASDITDIIYNVIGGILGIGIYNLLKLIFRKEEITNKIIIILGSIMMIIVIILLILLKVYN